MFSSGKEPSDSPTVDVWIDVNQMELRDVMMEGSFEGVAEAMKAEITTKEDGSRSGVSPVIWKSWETTGVDVSFDLSMDSSSKPTSSWRQGTAQEFTDMWTGNAEAHMERIGGVPGSFRVQESATDTTITTTGTVGVDLTQRRTGTQRTVTEEIDTSSLGDRIVNREVIHFMRSRNIEFTAKSLKPFTEVYPFFDNVDVSKFCMPKLIEVTMTSGTFEEGETVNGVMPSSITSEGTGGADQEEEDAAGTPTIAFRVATSNHKFGSYNDPRDIYDRNPYDREVRIPTDYTETTTLLNVDTFSLASEENSEFQGYIAKGMILQGASSNARATVSDVRLVTDRVGTLIGSFRVPSRDADDNPEFETGNNVFRLTSSSTNSKVEGLVTTACEDNFYSQGDTDNTEEVTLSLRNARVTHDDSFVEDRTIGDTATSSASTTVQTEQPRLTGEYKDPLAQSFVVDDVTGVYLTRIDLYFQEVPLDPTAAPVTVQIREVELGTPNQRILPFSEVSLNPDEIEVSLDSSVATSFNFESPVYLNGQREYAVVILSESTEYRVWTSRLGEVDISSINSLESEQILVTTQRLLGSLFKSQNASTWTPSQYEDLTFDLYRADFVPTGNIQLFNPGLDQQLEIIPPNGVVSQSRTIRVGLGTTATEDELLPGQLITQTTTEATGRFVGYAGSASALAPLNIINVGAGYTPSSGKFTYTGVAMTALSGHGVDATSDISFENGVAVGATISAGGKGYQVGDILAPISIGTGLGDGLRVSISTIFGNNELTITDVQGTFGTAAGEILNFTNASGVTAIFDVDANPAGLVPTSPITVVSNGDHLTINQRNHGMYSNTNLVTLRDIRSTVAPTNLTSAYSSTDTTSIAIGSTSNFVEFESLPVSVTNPGYIRMNNEIISYTGTDLSNNLTGITRGVDDTSVVEHVNNEIVTKYEFYGVSLRRINKTHNLNEVTEDNPFDTDFYKVKIDFSENGVDRTLAGVQKLYFNESASGGGRNARGTYNIPFSQIVPRIATVAPTGTTIDPSMRTVSSTSISGSEGSFVDQGFTKIALGQVNHFNTQRMVASPINEQTFLSDLPANKSLTISLNMSTTDSNISPGIDLDQLGVVLTSNRVNEPVSDYANDPRVDTVTNDPNKFMYVTKSISLDNPATSIQVLVDAFVPEDADLRMFFALDQDGPVQDTVFTPFPGFNNRAPNGSVIDLASNDGTPDSKLVKSDVPNPTPGITQFREVKFSIDKLPAFSSFRIKLVGTSTNQATPPMVRNFRVIGLA